MPKAKTRFILVIKPVSSEDLSEAVTTLVDTKEEVLGTIVGYMASGAVDDDIDGNLDWEALNEFIEDELNQMEEQTLIIVGESEDEDEEQGLEVLVKEI